MTIYVVLVGAAIVLLLVVAARYSALMDELGLVISGIDHVREHERGAIHDEVQQGLKGEQAPPTPQDAPPGDVNPHEEEGRDHARKRAQDIYERSAVPGGTTLISETLDVLTEPRLKRVEDAPNNLIIWALACTVSGLIISLWILGNVVGATGVQTLAVGRDLGHMALAFVPTAVGLGRSIGLRNRSTDVLHRWDEAVAGLDRALLRDVVAKRSQQDESLERAARMLLEAADAILGAGRKMDKRFDALGSAVSKLSDAVRTLDTDAVTERMETAAGTFGNALERSAGTLQTASEQVRGAGEQVAPLLASLELGARDMSSAVVGLHDSAATMSEQLTTVATALEPVRSIVVGLDHALATLQNAESRLGDIGVGLNTRIEALTGAVDQIGRLNAPLVERLIGVTGQLDEATIGFRQVVTDLQENAGVTRRVFDENTQTLRETTEQLKQMAATQTAFNRNALAKQREFDETALGELRASLEKSPPDIQRLGVATARLEAAADTLASAGERLSESLTSFETHVNATSSKLAGEFGQVPALLAPISELRRSLDRAQAAIGGSAEATKELTAQLKARTFVPPRQPVTATGAIAPRLPPSTDGSRTSRPVTETSEPQPATAAGTSEAEQSAAPVPEEQRRGLLGRMKSGVGKAASTVRSAFHRGG